MKYDIVCFSHIRWNFVYQRPQHLLSRFSKSNRVFFIEEPVWDAGKEIVSIKQVNKNIWVIVPYLASNADSQILFSRKKEVVDYMIRQMQIVDYIFWYYSPMALPYSSHAKPALIVYDCMDELSSFKNAPLLLKENENKLIEKADVMFMGGYSLYHAKQHLHYNAHPFPSSIDKEHFFTARAKTFKKDFYKNIPHPRLGFYGVLDERMNMQLLADIAKKNIHWHFVLIGPIAKISEKSIPRVFNIHYLGAKPYEELPAYLSGWDIAIMPFALNEATRFISPTKTPEFLAAGKPVISTSITDVVKPYGNKALVAIANTPDEFTAAAQNIFKTILADKYSYEKWLERVDSFLHGMSWDKTWQDMKNVIEIAIQKKGTENLHKSEVYV
jgi:glycosyltransferase involved in cell wall biosynthesis